MSQTLHEILLDVETKDFEKGMWDFAVENYFQLSERYTDPDMLLEKFYKKMDNKFHSSKRNKDLLEHMDIGPWVIELDPEYKVLVEKFEKQLEDNSVDGDEFLKTANELFERIENLSTNTHMSEGIMDKLLSGIEEKWNALKNSIGDLMGVFKQWGDKAGIAGRDMIAMLVQDGFMETFKEYGPKLLTVLQGGFGLWDNAIEKIQNKIKEAFETSGVGKNIDKFSKFLDKKLREEAGKPVQDSEEESEENTSNQQDKSFSWTSFTKKVIGVTVLTTSLYLWYKSFIVDGDPKYQFAGGVNTFLNVAKGNGIPFGEIFGTQWFDAAIWLCQSLFVKAIDLSIPCPPKCADISSITSMMGAAIVASYIVLAKGSLKDIKTSPIGEKIRGWLSTVGGAASFSMPFEGFDFEFIANNGGILKPIGG